MLSKQQASPKLPKTLEDVGALLAEQHLSEVRRLRRERRSKIVNSFLGLVAVIIVLVDGIYRVFGGRLLALLTDAVPGLLAIAFLYYIKELIIAISDRKV